MARFNTSTPLISLEAVVLDTETTGLDARTARIVQIGAVRVREGALVSDGSFDHLVNPGVPIPTATTAVHGLDDRRVAAATRFGELAPELEAFVAGAVIVGHTINYDFAVLAREYALAGRTWPGWRALDVRMLARLAAPSLAHYDLDRLCGWLGIENAARHNALGDAEATARVFVALLPLLRANGVRTLAEAEAASKELAEREAVATSGTRPALPEPAADDTRPLARIDSFPYRHRVRDVMSTPAIFAASQTSVRDAIALIIAKRISSVYVRGTDGVVGIVTERDLLRAIDADAGSGLALEIGSIAKKPLHTVRDDAFVYRAIGRMERLSFRHLGVRNQSGEIVGAVTTRSLLRHRASTAIVLGDEIDSAGSAAALGAAWAKLPRMARALMAEGVEPRTIAAVVSSEIAIMTRRAAQLAETEMAESGHGAPPSPYAVLVLGSAGRGESQLAADQDNAIVYAQGVEGGREDQWFEAMAKRMCAILDAAGVPYCKGGVMAQNRAWRMSLADWKARVDGWVRRKRGEDLLNIDIFFDSLPVYGERQLGEELWSYAYGRAHTAPDFVVLLTEVARERGSPFTLFGSFRVDGSGRIDVKKYGLMPIFTAARVLSIRHDVRARATPDRLEGVQARGVGSAETMQSIVAAQDELLGAVISQQLVDGEAGVPLSVRIDPKRLDTGQKAKLKAALSAVDTAIDLVSEGRL